MSYYQPVVSSRLADFKQKEAHFLCIALEEKKREAHHKLLGRKRHGGREMRVKMVVGGILFFLPPQPMWAYSRSSYFWPHFAWRMCKTRVAAADAYV